MRRKIIRVFGLALSGVGLIGTAYFFFPVLSWQLYLAPAFAEQNITTPIPKTHVVTESTFQSLISQSARAMTTNLYNANNWYPTAGTSGTVTPSLATYTLTIPKLKITNAEVSTVDADLARHLINWGGTSTPPNKGNSVIFGHSTLPQLYNPKDYKTIFAYAHTLKIGDLFVVDADNIKYTYKIENILIVDPDDTSVLAQSYDDSYLTVITCTPPGTTWKRLVLKSRLQKL